MRDAGKTGCEAGFYLAGYVEQQTCVIDTLCVPNQEATPVEFGCTLKIEGNEIKRLGREVEAVGRVFCGQIHSHPGEAFHSAPDDEAVAMRFHGSLSIVTPDFGSRGALPPDAAVYRFDVNLPGWRELDQVLRKRMVKLADNQQYTVIGFDA